MGGIRFVGLGIIEHSVQRGDERPGPGEPGEDRAIAYFGVEHEGRSLRDLQSVKFCGRFSDPLLDLG